MNGSCLCGSVTFEVEVQSLRLYRCHCSLCRRQSGTASNCAVIVDANHFRWLGGQECVGSWVKPSGYRNDFCSFCGSPVPRALSYRDAFWVPAGSLAGSMPGAVIADFFLSSRASWDQPPFAGEHHSEFPSAAEFFELMHPQ